MYRHGKEIKQKIGQEAASNKTYCEQHLTLLNHDTITVFIVWIIHTLCHEVTKPRRKM